MSTTLASSVRDKPMPITAEPVIEVVDVTKRYGRTVIHEHLNLEVRRGEILALLGGSGSGKTTLVRQILGLESPTSGTIRVLGEEWANMDDDTARILRTRSGMMFQQGALFSSLSVYDNIAQPFRELGQDSRGPDPRVRHAEARDGGLVVQEHGQDAGGPVGRNDQARGDRAGRSRSSPSCCSSTNPRPDSIRKLPMNSST